MAPFHRVFRRVLVPLAAGAFMLQTTTTCDSTVQTALLTGLQNMATVLVDAAFLAYKNNQESTTPAQFGAGNGQTSGTGGSTST